MEFSTPHDTRRDLTAVASSVIPVLTVTTPGSGGLPAPVTDGERRGLLAALSAIPDPRNPRGVRYPLAALLTVAVCAVLAGASSFAAITDWLYDLDEPAQVRLGFTRGVPAGTTVWRLLTRLDDGLLATVLSGWLLTRVKPVTARPHRYRTVIAIDGKTLRRPATADTADPRPAPSKPSRCRLPAASASHTPLRPSRSPAPPAARPAGKPRTWSCHCPPPTLGPPTCKHGPDQNG